MKTNQILASALLLTASLAFLPSAEAAPPIYCEMAPCGPGDGPTLPAICGETVNCHAECPELAIRTTDLFGYLGPSASILVHQDCTVDVSVDGTPCGSMFDAVDDQRQTVAGVDVEYDSCRFNPDCTCDPLPIEPASSAAAPPPGIQPPPQCFTQPCCFAPCPPPCDGCEPDPARCQAIAVSTSQVFAYYGPHVGVVLNSDCSVDVWEAGLQCNLSMATEERTVQTGAGPVGVSADVCLPVLDCTCPPLMATAAAVEPPVEVEFVTCVTAPCPPRVVCNEREIEAGPVAGAYLEHDCELTVGVVDGARVCGFNGLEHHQARQTVGLVTVVVNYCGITMA